MDKELVYEAAFDVACESGMSKQKYYNIMQVLDSIIAECKLDYSKKKLSIDSDVLTTILKVYDRSKVNGKIKQLQEEQNND